ncbi:unnamed protein product [Brachionus calyciflorus]|uniref:SWIM-type domain-containing protein n=1 Tax=Brachionus calyciflorus TaxID=104777 RepID=A0A813UXN3_9BILA|nr:unnamed protein product [Brachionus calyciflorus]
MLQLTIKKFPITVKSLKKFPVILIIKNWSIDRSSEMDKIKEFYVMPEFTTELWDATDEFIASKPKIKYIKDHDLYFNADVQTCNESFELVFEMLDCKISGCQCFREHYDFDQFILVNREIKRVYVNNSKWEFSTCTCKDYLKEYICKHIIAVTTKLKLNSIDYSYKDIGNKAKKGRKEQAKEWFVKQ